MDPVPASSRGLQGDLHFQAVWAASSCARGIWLQESHCALGPLESVLSVSIKFHWRQRESFVIYPPNPQDSVYFGAFNLQP